MVSLHRAEYLILQTRLPGGLAENFGVLLLDPESDRIYPKFRENCEAAPEDAEVLALLPEDLRVKAREIGGERLLAYFEDTLSNALRVTDRRPVVVRDFETAVERLYEDHIARVPREVANVIPFVTHVPLYSLRAAAGRFGQDMEVEPEDWVKAPAGVRAARDFYAVHVTGHSMEPEIPDGSVAVFKYHPAGSRHGKRVLVWRRGASGEGGEFTVKVYESEKRATEDGTEDGWEHRRIRLKPLNPDYPVLELDDESQYRVLGELVGLLGIDEL